jgi:hypothetical protein
LARPKPFENRVLRRIFESEREEMEGGWRKLHNDELYNFFSSVNGLVIRVIRSRRMKWVSHVARMQEMRDAYGILIGR